MSWRFNTCLERRARRGRRKQALSSNYDACDPPAKGRARTATDIDAAVAFILDPDARAKHIVKRNDPPGTAIPDRSNKHTYDYNTRKGGGCQDGK